MTDLEKAREEMRNATPQAPRPYQEDTTIMSNDQVPTMPTMQPIAQPQQPQNVNAAEAMTVADFLSAANSPMFVDKLWESKGKKVQIKKFKKGDLDKISAPLLSKTMKLDLNSAASGGKAQEMNLDISMSVFSDMEKIMVELGMSAYKDGRGQAVINRDYIDNVMPEDDFKELSALIREVNPKALMGNIDAVKDTEATKKP